MSNIQIYPEDIYIYIYIYPQKENRTNVPITLHIHGTTLFPSTYVLIFVPFYTHIPSKSTIYNVFANFTYRKLFLKK